MTTIADIAEAVKAALNAPPDGAFSQEFTAQRVYVPVADLEALDTLTVYVLGTADESQGAITRTTAETDMTVQIAVMKRIAGDPTTEAANAELDPLTLLVRQIATYFKPGQTLGELPAYFQKSTTALVYDTERLRQKTFMSLVSVTFRLRFNHRTP